VVKNNSADNTTGVVEAFAATARVRVRYRVEARQGLSHARNAGLALAEGHIVAFTDDDVGPAPDWVARVVAAMREHGADVLGGPCMARATPSLADGTARPPRMFGDRGARCGRATAACGHLEREHGVPTERVRAGRRVRSPAGHQGNAALLG
jgi:glycosyltransferase involved in cell wall biosynthesis